MVGLQIARLPENLRIGGSLLLQCCPRLEVLPGGLHVAGDLVPEPRRHPTEDFDESVLGTGFWHLGEEVHSPVDVRADQAGRIDNKIDVFSKTFLGLTVACARCHDHKFDAISTKDYYALSGYMLSSSYRQVRFDSRLPNARTWPCTRISPGTRSST